MVRFDGCSCVEEYAAVCTSVSKGASRLTKCGKQLRAAEKFENRVEGQRLLVVKHHGRYVVTDFAFSQEFWKLSDTTHLRSNHAKDHEWERFGNSKPSIVFNAQRVVTGNILLIYTLRQGQARRRAQTITQLILQRMERERVPLGRESQISYGSPDRTTHGHPFAESKLKSNKHGDVAVCQFGQKETRRALRHVPAGLGAPAKTAQMWLLGLARKSEAHV